MEALTRNENNVEVKYVFVLPICHAGLGTCLKQLLRKEYNELIYANDDCISKNQLINNQSTRI